ncbi:MAG: hypothetical protein QOH17_2929, partial [Pseudonocardiales bacterium]|nr:hypothetical protein [Pseudonocardiales bacterium]
MKAGREEVASGQRPTTVGDMTATVELFADQPPDRVLTDPDVLASYARDEAEWAEAGRAIAVVRPQSTA